MIVTESVVAALLIGLLHLERPFSELLNFAIAARGTPTPVAAMAVRCGGLPRSGGPARTSPAAPGRQRRPARSRPATARKKPPKVTAAPRSPPAVSPTTEAGGDPSALTSHAMTRRCAMARSPEALPRRSPVPSFAVLGGLAWNESLADGGKKGDPRGAAGPLREVDGNPHSHHPAHPEGRRGGPFALGLRRASDAPIRAGQPTPPSRFTQRPRRSATPAKAPRLLRPSPDGPHGWRSPRSLASLA